VVIDTSRVEIVNRFKAEYKRWIFLP